MLINDTNEKSKLILSCCHICNLILQGLFFQFNIFLFLLNANSKPIFPKFFLLWMWIATEKFEELEQIGHTC